MSSFGEVDLELGLPHSSQTKSSSRSYFIMKVLLIVGVQLLVTTFISATCYTNTAFRNMSNDNFYTVLISMTIVALVAMIVCYLSVSCCRNNIVAFFPFCIFTVSMSIVFAMACLQYNVQVLIQSATITCVTTLACVIYILITKKDLHSWHGVLSCGLIVLIVWGIIMSIFTPSDTIQIVYSLLGVIIFVGYILVDTSDLLNGRYQDHEYFIAAIGIYLDIINLMLYVLELVNKCKDDDS